MKHIIALIVTLTTSAALAGTPLDPPARYDHPYMGNLTIVEVDRDNVWAECSGDGQVEMRADAAGCAETGDGECTIWLAMKTTRAPVKAILRHEIAHCNGWPADHPD
ncbi:MAG: hypothetical protein ACRC14_02680 [Paracoccaceae bacterium]